MIFLGVIAAGPRESAAECEDSLMGVLGMEPEKENDRRSPIDIGRRLEPMSMTLDRVSRTLP